MGLAVQMLMIGGLVASPEEGREKLKMVLDTGKAVERFAQNIREQGGPSDLIENRQRYLEAAPLVRPVTATKQGWISGIDTRGLGMAVLRLGGGRMQVEDTIDPRVGLSELCSVGDKVEHGQPLCMVHAGSEAELQAAIERVNGAISISQQACERLPAIYEQLSGEQLQT